MCGTQVTRAGGSRRRHACSEIGSRQCSGPAKDVAGFQLDDNVMERQSRLSAHSTQAPACLANSPQKKTNTALNKIGRAHV